LLWGLIMRTYRDHADYFFQVLLIAGSNPGLDRYGAFQKDIRNDPVYLSRLKSLVVDSITDHWHIEVDEDPELGVISQTVFDIDQNVLGLACAYVWLEIFSSPESKFADVIFSVTANGFLRARLALDKLDIAATYFQNLENPIDDLQFKLNLLLYTENKAPHYSNALAQSNMTIDRKLALANVLFMKLPIYRQQQRRRIQKVMFNLFRQTLRNMNHPQQRELINRASTLALITESVPQGMSWKNLYSCFSEAPTMLQQLHQLQEVTAASRGQFYEKNFYAP
jgi:hypothetical protein